MPSIYDLFGNAKGLQGLLSDADIGSAQGDALLQASLALMEAGGPSTTPTSFGQALAGAYGKGREAFKSGIEGQVGNVLTAQKIAELKRQQDIRAARQKILSGMSGEMSATDALAQGGGPTPENAAKIGMPRQMDANRLNQAIAGLLSIQDVEGAKELNELRKSMFPTFKTQSVQELRIGDTNKKFAVGDDGSLREIGVSPEDLMQVDLGGQKALVGKTTGKVLARYGVSMTPDAVASNTVARRNAAVNEDQLDLSQQKFQYEKTQGKMTEGQAGAAGYADRMKNADAIIAKAPAPDESQILMGKIPLAGRMAQNYAMKPEQQQYYQAAQDWIRAKLRKESGAAIGLDEMQTEYETYFPQPGDSQEVKNQKAIARRQAEFAMTRGAGPSYQPNLAGVPENLTNPKIVDWKDLAKTKGKP